VTRSRAKTVSDVAPGLIRALTEDGIYSVLTEHATDGGVTRFTTPGRNHRRPARHRAGAARRPPGRDRPAATPGSPRGPPGGDPAVHRRAHRRTDRRLAVDFLEQALDHHGAGVFLADDAETALRPAALTATTAGYYDDEGPDARSESVPFDAYESGGSGRSTPTTPRPLPSSRSSHSVSTASWPSGSREESGFASDDEQFAEILARTTQVARSHRSSARGSATEQGVGRAPERADRVLQRRPPPHHAKRPARDPGAGRLPA